MLRFRNWICVFLFLLAKTSVGQDFRLGIRLQKDSMIYYVVNQTDQPINAGAIICTWFHNTELMVFWPADLGIGLGTVTKTGNFSGRNVNFNRRTTQRVSFDFDIYPGDSQEFVTVQNYSDIPQEIMCTNVRLFYSDTGGVDQESDVYPLDQNPCPFKQVFLVGNLSDDGIRFWTTANKILHYSTTCKTGFDVVVIDRSSLEPTHVLGQTPLCADGRKWKSFGHSKNEQVYYHFDFKDTQHIQAFVDLIDAVNPGDHVFISHSSRNPVDLTNPKVQDALEKLGGDANLKSYQTKLKAGNVLMGYGNKGSNSGTLELFAEEDIKKEYVLLPDQVYDESKSFAPCFEATLRDVEKAQEVLDTSGNNTHIRTISKRSRVFPNPASDLLWVITEAPRQSIQLFGYTGVQLNINVFRHSHNSYRLNLDGLSKGLYLLKIGHETHRIMIQ